MPAQLLSLPYTFGAKLGVVRHSSLVDAVFGCYGVTWDDMQRHANQPELCRKQLPPVSQHHRRFLVSGSSPAQQWSLLPPGAIHLCCGLFLWPPVVLGGPRDLQAVKAALAFFEAAFLRRQGESPGVPHSLCCCPVTFGVVSTVHVTSAHVFLDPAGVLFLAKALSALGHHKAVVDMVSCVLEGDPCVLESRRYPDRTDIGHLILVQLSSSIVQVAQKDPAMYSTAAMECLLDALAPYIDSPACDAVSTIGRVWLHALFPWQGAPPASAAAASLLPAHPFYRRLLRQQVLPTLDTHVKVLRPLLLHSLVRDADTSLVSAAVTLGMQGLRCGFPWRVDPEESAACDFLVYTLSSAPLPAALPNIASCCCCIAALSMYLDLSSHPGIMDKLSSAVNATSPSGSKAESPALSNTTLEDLSLLASAAQDMAASRTSMAVQTYGAGGGTNRDTSTVVQAFYNSNPFPVWSNAATAGSFSYKTPTQFLSLFLPAFECHAFSKAKPESMLIAGCGSGHEVVTALHDFTECSVVAIDLSSTNLVYAKRHISRKYSSLESRLTLGHADLLDRTALAQLPGQPFTHIQSVGMQCIAVCILILFGNAVLPDCPYQVSCIISKTLQRAWHLFAQCLHLVEQCTWGYIHRGEPNLLRKPIQAYSLSSPHGLLCLATPLQTTSYGNFVMLYYPAVFLGSSLLSWSARALSMPLRP